MSTYKIIALCIGIFIYISSTPFAIASDWVYVVKTVDGDEWYLDRDGIEQHAFLNKANGYYLSTWTKIEYKNTQTSPDGRKYNKVIVFKYFDYTNKKSKIAQTIAYYNDRVIADYTSNPSTYSSSAWDRVVPDTVGEDLLQTAHINWIRNTLLNKKF